MATYVTIIINTVNEIPERLIRAIDSYRIQRGVKTQIIVSTIEDDPAISIAKQMQVECVINPSKGIYEQLNYVIRYIKGDWWCYASGNDTADSFKCSEEIRCCLKNNKLVCYSSYTIINPKTNHREYKKLIEYSHEEHLKRNFISDCAMQHVSLIRKYAPFKNDLWQNDSFYDYWLRIYKNEGNVFCYNPTSTWNYFEYENSKHILRQNNPEELALYQKIREKMLDSHKQ